MADVVIEDAYLEQLRSGYARVRDLFTDASRDSGVIPGVVGDPTLAARTREFYDGWDSVRTDLIDVLEGLCQSVQTVADSFAEADRQLGSSATDMVQTTS